MGADIHMIVQRLEDGTWMTTSGTPVLSHRWYTHFGILAGVRSNDPPPAAPPRGLPPDLQPRLKQEPGGWGCVDGLDLGEHSYSWLLVSELDAYFAARPELREDEYVNCNDFFELIDEWRRLSRTGDGSDVRIVFGFDS